MNLRNKLILFGFVCLALTVFLIVYSLGNYWDWYFPYFSSGIKNIFWSKAYSWNDVYLGKGLEYASNYYANFFISRFNFIKPEYLQGGLVTLTLTATSYIIFIFNKNINKLLLIPLALLTIFNPAMFYKLEAGHVYYIFSLPIFFYIIYFLIKKFNNTVKDYLLLSLLLAIVGIQIQFFVFSLIVLVIYFLIYKNKFSLSKTPLLILIPIIINLPWLSNFILGVNNLSQYSYKAGSEMFADSMFANPVRIIMLVFSPATNIQYIYSNPEILFMSFLNLLLIVSIFYYFFIKNKRSRVVQFFSICWVAFVILGTGYFQLFKLPLLSKFYPMFREAGHFAPIIIILGLLLMASIASDIKISKRFKQLFFIYATVFICLNVYNFIVYLPRVNYNNARSSFQTFEKFNQRSDGSYRILTYPFWNQYGFINNENKIKNNKLINNSGWDSYINFSGKESIGNYISGNNNIDDTLQYRLLETLSIDELKKKNIKYIYDFSGIYESNFDRYTAPENYFYSKEYIKNKPNFIKSLVEKNPNEIFKVGDNIYEIKNFYPRISSNNLTFKKINPTQYEIKIKNLQEEQEIVFLDSYNKNWSLYIPENNISGPINCSSANDFDGFKTKECLGEGDVQTKISGSKRDIFSGSHKLKYDYANSWKISKDQVVDFYESTGSSNKNIVINDDGSVDVSMILYFWPQSYFNIFLVLSIITVICCTSYLLFYKPKDKYEKN